jgi:hypothetical protein
MVSFGFGDWLLLLLKAGLQTINPVVAMKRIRVQTNKAAKLRIIADGFY